MSNEEVRKGKPKNLEGLGFRVWKPPPSRSVTRKLIRESQKRTVFG